MKREIMIIPIHNTLQQEETTKVGYFFNPNKMRERLNQHSSSLRKRGVSKYYLAEILLNLLISELSLLLRGARLFRRNCEQLWLGRSVSWHN